MNLKLGSNTDLAPTPTTVSTFLSIPNSQTQSFSTRENDPSQTSDPDLGDTSGKKKV